MKLPYPMVGALGEATALDPFAVQQNLDAIANNFPVASYMRGMTNAETGNFTTATNVVADAASVYPLKLDLTPAVAGVWTVWFNCIARCPDSGWDSLYASIQLSVADATGHYEAFGAAIHVNAVTAWVSPAVSDSFSLKPGVKYTAAARLVPVLGNNWRYYQGPDYLRIHALFVPD